MDRHIPGSRLAFRWVLLALLCTALCPGVRAQGDQQTSGTDYVAFGKFEETGGVVGAPPGAVSPRLQQQYVEAVLDAAVAEPDEIFYGLKAVIPEQPGLVWREEGGTSQVLVLVWTSYTGYDPFVGQDIVLARDAWVTLVPDVAEFCAHHRQPPDRLTLRLIQLLGLPPNNKAVRFVEIWVSPHDLFRPSPDPTITDHEAELRFPESMLFSMISPDYITWFNHQKSISYNFATGAYPWTRLGYTYDWSGMGSEVGLSEFVIRQGATVGINRVMTNDVFFSLYGNPGRHRQSAAR